MLKNQVQRIKNNPFPTFFLQKDKIEYVNIAALERRSHSKDVIPEMLNLFDNQEHGAEVEINPNY
jgi:hypothetical protein